MTSRKRTFRFGLAGQSFIRPAHWCGKRNQLVAEIIDQCTERQRCGMPQGQRRLMRKPAPHRNHRQLRRRDDRDACPHDIDRDEAHDLTAETQCRGRENPMAVEKEADKHAEDISGGDGAVERQNQRQRKADQPIYQGGEAAGQ